MFCVNCGAENPQDAGFCHSCGRRLFRLEQRISEASSARQEPASSPEVTRISDTLGSATKQPLFTDGSSSLLASAR
jgi:ribosomal protein L40E